MDLVRTKASVYTSGLAFSTIFTVATERFGVLFWIILLFITLMVVDYITGMLASRAKAIENPEDPETGWQSKKGMLGVLKKLGYLFIIVVALAFDFLIYTMGDYLHVSIPVKTFFSMFITTMLILNELLSILENAGRMGADVPPFLAKAITVIKNQTEKKGEDFNG